MCPESFGVVRFDLGSLLQGQMWYLIPMMDYISPIIGHTGFGCEENFSFFLWKIICNESYGGVTFNLGPLLQRRMWSLITIMAYISLAITCGGFGCEDNLNVEKS